jgi:hypothetical protein
MGWLLVAVALTLCDIEEVGIAGTVRKMRKVE